MMKMFKYVFLALVVILASCTPMQQEVYPGARRRIVCVWGSYNDLYCPTIGYYHITTHRLPLYIRSDRRLRITRRPSWWVDEYRIQRYEEEEPVYKEPPTQKEPVTRKAKPRTPPDTTLIK